MEFINSEHSVTLVYVTNMVASDPADLKNIITNKKNI